MPELPEVETVLRGIKPHIIKHKIKKIVIRRPNLRWPIPTNLDQLLKNSVLKDISRRGKYLLFHFARGTLIVHLGMSGRLTIVDALRKVEKHDHVDFCFNNHLVLRYTDPRRFGAILWSKEEATTHPLLRHIGPEPLSRALTGNYLWQKAQNKKTLIKSFLLDHRVVAGVGNIYATEALFAAKIHPLRLAGQLSSKEYEALSRAIKHILKQAIKKGGTTLKDFLQTDGKPGYFSIALKAYGQEGKPCSRCRQKLKTLRIAGRSTVFCPRCQPLL